MFGPDVLGTERTTQLLAFRDGAAPVLTIYLDHLQRASAGTQIAASLLNAQAIGLGPFAAHALIDHVRVNLQAARRTQSGTGLQLALGGR